MITLIYLLVVLLAGWQLACGLRTGEMSALGQIYATAQRVKRPVRFWFFASFNVLLIAAGVILLAEELQR